MEIIRPTRESKAQIPFVIKEKIRIRATAMGSGSI
jgi:hypothetical protein